jgi:protein translocase SecG subunit
MLKIFWILLDIILIFLIFVRTPKDVGLESFASTNKFLGSPSSAENFLNKFTWFLIISYFILAFKFNL